MKTNNITRNILIVLLLIAGAYLFLNHGRHLAPYLPFTFLLGCLFMHLFMHGGHGGHGGNNTGQAGQKDNQHNH